MKIEVVFPRPTGGQLTKSYDVKVIPTVGATLTTTGDDSWLVNDVTHYMPGSTNRYWQQTGIVARLRVS